MFNQKIAKFAKEKERTIKEICNKFGISEMQSYSLRRRLKENHIKTKDTRGRKKIEF